MTDQRKTAVRNLAILHQEITPQAVEEEVRRLDRAVGLIGTLRELRMVAV